MKRILMVVSVLLLLGVMATGIFVVPGVIRAWRDRGVDETMNTNPFSMPPTDEWVVIEPGSWWRTTLNEEQMATLRGIWGTQITEGQVVKKLWPEVLDEIPEYFSGYLSGSGFEYWPMEDGVTLSMDQALAKGKHVDGGGRFTDEDRPISECPYQDFYIGKASDEKMPYTWSGGLPSDMYFRISMYVS